MELLPSVTRRETPIRPKVGKKPRVKKVIVAQHDMEMPIDDNIPNVVIIPSGCRRLIPSGCRRLIHNPLLGAERKRPPLCNTCLTTTKKHLRHTKMDKEPSAVLLEPKVGRKSTDLLPEHIASIHEWYLTIGQPKQHGVKVAPNKALSAHYNDLKKRVTVQRYLKSDDYERFKSDHPWSEGKGMSSTTTGGGIYDYGKAVLLGRNDYPPNVRDIIATHGDVPIMSIRIGRTPLGPIETGANILTFGEFKKRLVLTPYDELYHLFIEVRLSPTSVITIEKNQVINMAINQTAPTNTTFLMIDKPMPSNLTIKLMMENTRVNMADKFFPYDVRDNNCQDFIIAILSSNNLSSQESTTFVKQDLRSILRIITYYTKL